MCQTDGYVHQPFKCIRCRADLVETSFLEAYYTRDMFVIFLCTLQTDVYHFKYTVSNMTKKVSYTSHLSKKLYLYKNDGQLNGNRGVPQGTILGPILFSVMLSDIQAVDSDSSTLVKFADDLTLSVLVKEIQGQAPQEVQNILSWAQNNLMTINITKTRRRLQRLPVSLAWRLDREMRMRLILHKTGFTR